MQFNRDTLEDMLLMVGCICLSVGLIYSDFVPFIIEVKDFLFYGK